MPIEFTLPVFLLYSPQPFSAVNGHLLLKPPVSEELAITVAPSSKESFELAFHQESSSLCHPYSKTAFPLEGKKEYILEVKAYADNAKPSRLVTYKFAWDGTENNLANAIPLPSEQNW